MNQFKRDKARQMAAHHRKGGPISATPYSVPPSWLDKVQFLFFHQGNYSFGTPDPEYFDQPPYNYLKGIGSTTVEEYADPLTGLISIGFVGGNFFNAAGGVFSTSPMPEQFNYLIPCDGVSVAASIYQVADISNINEKTRLSITAGLQCPVRNSDPNDTNESVNGVYAIYPGLASSAMSGLVCVTGYFNLTVSSALNGQIVKSNTNTAVLLQRMMNNSGGPGSYGAYFNILADECVFIDPSTVDQTIYLSTDFQLGLPEADQLIVEAQVRLVGLRAGHGDPGAGFVGAKFQNVPDYKHVTPIDIGFYGYACPFQVVNIGAFFV